MEYNKLVAVSGLSGLFELISSKNDGAIVRSLNDKTTKFASSRIHQFSHLESIEIYTIRENVNLVDVFTVMKADTTPLPDVKDDKAVRAYFQKVYADMDFDRVYVSDMKKIVKWFDLLQKNNIEIKLTQAEEAETGEPEVAEETEAAPAKKKPAAKAKEEKETISEEEGTGKKEKAPAKKAAAKKAAKKKED
ncbi:DUF5606 family protein [Niabella drilacis]|uniref:Uncharacterized protein n=1 Tax=Niabella drilacis (strain DSM 25811 / CCM 8410 / CCUG 62505 / LMG 26954 / E90) TaxID=1285928 RepID=A0A1G6Q7B5_NIADE|nr:DUF5606 domain-containing protein [Niabella drilacis]SDC87527.1 hypothetical protein SAMN04487894_104284 [Niabella drilacis]